jgi:hypothetical protein
MPMAFSLPVPLHHHLLKPFSKVMERRFQIPTPANGMQRPSPLGAACGAQQLNQRAQQLNQRAQQLNQKKALSQKVGR